MAEDRTQPFRLGHGGRIDRSQPLSFRFDGRAMQGFVGDTLASALLANGVRLVGRSFKYHRPRGIFSAGTEEPNALVELRQGAWREPNTRATTVELFEGLEAVSQNRWPSLTFDAMAINQWFSPMLGAGFYYKTFMWPSRFWEKLYEPAIRRAAGLGRAAEVGDPDRYEKAWLHCDVLIVGGGAGGISAALAAGRSGARVAIVDDGAELGGRLLSDRSEIDGVPSVEWLAAAVGELTAMANVRVLTRTTVTGVYDGETYAAVERVSDHLATPSAYMPRQCLWRIVARRCVLASGAIERPVAFADNDRPGVMLSSAVRTYIERYAVRPSHALVVFTNNDDGWLTAVAARKAGVDVAAVVDPREGLSETVRATTGHYGLRHVRGVVSKAIGSKYGLRRVVVRRMDGGAEEFEADGLAVSGGWNPNIALACHLRGRPVWREQLSAFVAGELPPGMAITGAASGRYELADCLADGHRSGVEAANDCGYRGASGKVPGSAGGPVSRTPPLWRVTSSDKGAAFVDLQHDVTVKDVAIAHREGYQAVEHLKRYTTLGMATDQGKTSNVVGLAIMAELAGKSVPDVGTTLLRPPYTPVAMGVLAGTHRGRDFRPVRRTPMHAWAEEQGAVFVDSGQWKRAQWYPRDGETTWRQSVDREARAVRDSVGFCDVSTLGKIDVFGRDAGAFLDRLYCNAMSGLAVGRARYGLMLREDGFVFDDGTVSRLAEDHFFVTTTTAKAGPVMQHMEYARQVIWPELDVQITSASDQWAQVSLAGPKARDVLAALVEDRDVVSDAALPFMGVTMVPLRGGLAARVYRISYSGELAYEIGVPARYGDALVRNLMIAGEPFAITAYGTEALNVLRIEKGHVGGAEINGMTTASDLGLGRMLSKKKDFIGRVLSDRLLFADPARMCLVGLTPLAHGAVMSGGAHIIPDAAFPGPETDQGYVTSVCHSPALGHMIALAMVSRGRERHGEVVCVHDPLRGRDTRAQIVAPVFVDPEGRRVHG